MCSALRNEWATCIRENSNVSKDCQMDFPPVTLSPRTRVRTVVAKQSQVTFNLLISRPLHCEHRDYVQSGDKTDRREFIKSSDNYFIAPFGTGPSLCVCICISREMFRAECWWQCVCRGKGTRHGGKQWPTKQTAHTAKRQTLLHNAPQ